MSQRILLLVAAAAVLASPLSFASPEDGFRAMNNEVSYEFVGSPGTLTREEVKRELEAARRDGSLIVYQRSAVSPAGATPRSGFVSSREEVRQAMRLREQETSTGWIDIGGEVGRIFVGR